MASEPTSPTSPTTPLDDRQATREWLEVILDSYHRSKKPDAHPYVLIRDWNINPVVGEREGYLSELLRVTVSYTANNKDLQCHLVCKLLPQDPFNRAFVIETLFDLREIKFYTEIKPALDAVEQQYLTEDAISTLWCPEFYYAKHKEASESILVLNDMCHCGYEIQALTKGLTIPQVQAALTTLANVHAAAFTLELKEKKPLQQRYPYLLSKEQATESFHSLINRGLPLLFKFLETRKDHTAIKECLQQYTGQHTADTLNSVLKPSEKLNTLVHCDFWCNNLLFKKEGDNTLCCIIDWQMVTYGRPVIDVAMLLCTSLEASDRRKHGPSLLTDYWNAFTSRVAKFGIDEEAIKYTKDDLEADFKAATAMSALVIVGSIDIALGTPEREERVLQLLTDLMNDGVL